MWLVLVVGGGVGIKIPYSQGTCENQLDFEQQFSPLPPQQQQLLFAWQHPTAPKTRKNDPFKGRLATTLLIFSFVRESWPAHGNVVLLKLS